MKKYRKLLLALVCVIAVASASVLGTLAYLTDTDEVVNTFTVGQVGLSLDETDVDEKGQPIEGADRVKSNEYHLLPGLTYVKDPTVTVDANSEEAYVRMILTVHNASAVQAILTNHNLGDFSVLLKDWDETVWIYEGFEEDTAANTISFEFRYKSTVDADDTALPLDPLFKSITVPGEATNEEMKALNDGSFKMVVVGHAIQAAGFDSEDAAWDAFEDQVG